MMDQTVIELLQMQGSQSHRTDQGSFDDEWSDPKRGWLLKSAKESLHPLPRLGRSRQSRSARQGAQGATSVFKELRDGRAWCRPAVPLISSDTECGEFVGRISNLR